VKAVCHMAKTDTMRQQALQQEVARASARAEAAERAQADLAERVRQLQVSNAQGQGAIIITGVTNTFRLDGSSSVQSTAQM
jgi:hypothetical protein